MTCFKLRWGYENALIYSKLPRIKKRNALIDLEDGLDRLCNPDDPAICSELANVERAIRKLAA